MQSIAEMWRQGESSWTSSSEHDTIRTASVDPVDALLRVASQKLDETSEGSHLREKESRRINRWPGPRFPKFLIASFLRCGESFSFPGSSSHDFCEPSSCLSRNFPASLKRAKPSHLRSSTTNFLGLPPFPRSLALWVGIFASQVPVGNYLRLDRICSRAKRCTGKSKRRLISPTLVLVFAWRLFFFEQASWRRIAECHARSLQERTQHERLRVWRLCLAHVAAQHHGAVGHGHRVGLCGRDDGSNR